MIGSRRQPARLVLGPPGTGRPANPWPYRWSRRRPSSQPSPVPRVNFRRITRFSSTIYSSFFMVGSTMPENLTSPTLKARPLAGRAEPAQEKAEQLPQRIEPEAARHDGIALEMAGEEPESRASRRARRRCGHGHARRRLRRLEMRSNISIGGSGNCALPGPNSSPRAQASRS